jgi:hypothetical protein
MLVGGHLHLIMPEIRGTLRVIPEHWPSPASGGIERLRLHADLTLARLSTALAPARVVALAA